ncbi:MAG TPA: Holliday junction resolvase RuvX [Pirellulaceae bacterium]|nr:Holliday junction resolvase RuvX [Planctomycetales bacterium]MCB9941009.1 Holliday junction resolvase RuvX [Planctomycetaceae bacterium]HRX78509.1 Holliday junction resolvase RuvX [Pirellulaceae bacterium]
MNDSLPSEGRLAGVDFGTVRIGIAVSDARQTLASPLDNYARGSKDQDAAYFRRLVKDEALVGFVVGLPVHMSGDESQKSQEARAFGQWLGDTTGLPVGFYDERYSSSIADDFLAAGQLTKKQRQKRRDMLAAQVILASYLESNRQGMGRKSLDD